MFLFFDAEAAPENPKLTTLNQLESKFLHASTIMRGGGGRWISEPQVLHKTQIAVPDIT